jgi:hypothetical protein
LKVRHLSVWLATNQYYFGAAGEVFFEGNRKGIFERFVHFLGQAYSAGNPLGRLASEVLGLNNAGVTPALLQELPGDSSHQTRGGQDCDVGLLAKRRPSPSIKLLSAFHVTLLL